MRFSNNRRGFLGMGISLAGALPLAHLAAAPTSPSRPSRALPRRGTVLFKGGFVMTMDSELGDLADADVLVKDGKIVSVGKNLSAPGARVINAKNMIVMPGLVETHWHLWNSLLRSMAGDAACCGYFPTSAGLGRFFTPGDMYAGVRLAAAEAIDSGITTVHDWAHNPRTPEHAEENLRALRESGIRARFSYGPARGIPVTETVNLDDIRRLHADWKSYANEGLISLGLAWRGVQYAVTDQATGKMGFQNIPESVYRTEYDTARSLGIPLTAHCNIGSRIDFGHAAKLDQLGLLYEDLQLVHMVSSTQAEIDAVAKAGSSVSFSPYTEMRTGFGFPDPTAFLKAGVKVGLSVDTTTLSGSGNMFEIMKGIQNIANGKALSEYDMPARTALELGTLGGARSLGIGQQTGSLKPGKHADVIMVDTRSLNIGMFTDPAHMVVEAANPASVNLVMVDGRILKEHGKLTAVHAGEVVVEASKANMALRKRANWRY
ncbi:MAG: amidohydrolase [Polaromonas sp.]|nr:amidohydrolase [Polaromonas sp.]